MYRQWRPGGEIWYLPQTVSVYFIEAVSLTGPTSGPLWLAYPTNLPYRSHLIPVSEGLKLEATVTFALLSCVS